jgi:hypothetical protein
LRTASATARATGSGFLAIRSITITPGHDSHLAVKKSRGGPASAACGGEQQKLSKRYPADVRYR